MPVEEWADINECVRSEWKAETTPFERVYEVVEGVREGQSAAEIADRALVSEPTARQHCRALVNTGVAVSEQDGRTTLYRVNPDRMLVTRIDELREETTREELLDGVRRMKSELAAYEEEYGVRSPEELARKLDGDDEAWEAVTAWRTTRRNLAIAEATLAYDEASHQLTA